MIDATDQERQAMRTALTFAAEIMEEIGWQTRFRDLSESQVLTLIEAVIDGYQHAMANAPAQPDADSEVPF